jgi:hypothetical protein
MEVERVKVTVITNQNEIDTWIDKDINAQGIIFYNIEPSFQVALEGSGSSNEMWNRLILQYAQVAIANADFLLGKFQLYKMDPGNETQSSSINLVSELTIFFPRSLCYGTHKQTKNDGRRIKQHRMPRIRTGTDCENPTNVAAKFQTFPVSVGQRSIGREESGKLNCQISH